MQGREGLRRHPASEQQAQTGNHRGQYPASQWSYAETSELILDVCFHWFQFFNYWFRSFSVRERIWLTINQCAISGTKRRIIFKKIFRQANRSRGGMKTSILRHL